MKNYLQLLQRYKIHHIIFWISYILIWVWFYHGFYDSIITLFKVTLVYASSHAFMYYITQYGLIPYLLRKRMIWLFFLGFLVILIVAITYMYFTIQWIVEINLVGTFGPSVLAIYMFFGFSNVFMVTLLLSIKMILDKIRNQRKEEVIKKERLESELQYLKAQINPHLLFNTLNSVYVLIKKDPEKAADTLIKLSNLLRAQLYEFGTDKISIEEEINYLENYIELEKIRKGKYLTVEFATSPVLRDFSISPLMLIPFLENCFKHVSSHPANNNLIRVHLGLENKKLKAVFFNTCDQKSHEESIGGIGLKNVRRRLDLLYPHSYTLNINEQNDSFEVVLTLDINES